MRLAPLLLLVAGCSSKPASAPAPAPAPVRASVPRVGSLHATLSAIQGAALPPTLDASIVVGQRTSGGAMWNAMARGWGRGPGLSGAAFRVAGAPSSGRSYTLVAARSAPGPAAPQAALADGQASLVLTEGAEHQPVYWTATSGRLEVTAADGESLSFRVADAALERLTPGATMRLSLEGTARLHRTP